MDLSALKTLVGECDENNDYRPLGPALEASFSTLDGPETAWEILCIDGLTDVSFGDGRFPEEVVAALLGRALSLGDAELLGIVVRLAVYRPDELMEGNTSTWKVLAAHAEDLRSAWDDASPALKAQLLRALRCADAFDDGDGRRLVELLSNHGAPEAVALGAWLAADIDTDGLTHRLQSLADHPSHLVQLGVAVALDARNLVPPTAAEAVRRAIETPTPLPSWWAWRTLDAWESTDALAHRVSARDGEAANPVLEALLARDPEELRERDVTKLHRLLFPDEDDPLGLLPAEVTPDQSRFLRMLRAPSELFRYGLGRKQGVAAFLAQEPPFWSSVPVVVGGEQTDWPGVRVWKARVWDVLGHDAALEAVKHLPARHLFELTCTQRRGILLQGPPGSKRVAEHHDRDRALIEAVLEAIDEAEGLAPLVWKAVERGDYYDTVALGLATCRVLTQPGVDPDLTEEGWSQLADLFRRLSWREALRPLVASVPEGVRNRLSDVLDASD